MSGSQASHVKRGQKPIRKAAHPAATIVAGHWPMT
jgi:hypothetical protein